MDENDISFIIRGAIYKVYNNLGPGLLESVYERILKYELEKEGLLVDSQVRLPLEYDSIKMDVGYRLDLLVENRVIIEVKSVDEISSVYHKQLLTYLRISKKKLGILVNFNTANINTSIFRKVNNL